MPVKLSKTTTTYKDQPFIDLQKIFSHRYSSDMTVHFLAVSLLLKVSNSSSNLTLWFYGFVDELLSWQSLIDLAIHSNVRSFNLSSTLRIKKVFLAFYCRSIQPKEDIELNNGLFAWLVQCQKNIKELLSPWNGLCGMWEKGSWLASSL